MSPPSTPRAFFENVLPARLAAGVVDGLPRGVRVAFRVTGDGGGDYVLDRPDQGPPSVRPWADAPMDCEMRCTVDVFMRLLRGTLEARDAYLSGLVQVSGDVGLVLRLRSVLREPTTP